MSQMWLRVRRGKACQAVQMSRMPKHLADRTENRNIGKSARMTTPYHGHRKALPLSRSVYAFAFSLGLAAAGLLQGGAVRDWPQLSRTNLLQFVSAGQVMPVHSTRDWQKRRESIKAAMQEVMGPLPGTEKRCALDVRVEEQTVLGDYVRRLISYAAEPNERVPAYLL